MRLNKFLDLLTTLASQDPLEPDWLERVVVAYGLAGEHPAT